MALLVAPFAAVADAPFSEGGLASVPPGWARFRGAFLPLFTFASAELVLYAWQLVVVAAILLVLVAARDLPRLARTLSLGASRALSLALALLTAQAIGIALESIGGAWPALQQVGFALYLPTTFLAPLAALVAGLVSLRARALPRAASWSLVAAPLFLVAAMLAFQQFPGGTAPGLLLPWTLAVALSRA